MSNKIGIATVFGGYNYGSALQACATKMILRELGYEGEILKLKGSLVAGRDVRVKKLATILFRSVFNRGGMKNLKNYGDSVGKKMPEQSVALFDGFTESTLSPTALSYGALKKKARGEEYCAFVCGSDQVWNSAVLYVDPFYYLRFAPERKRIAFAPSFGRDFVPDYNKKKIAKYIDGFRRISVREASGEPIVSSLVGKRAEVLVDPTLAVSAEEWTRQLGLGEGSGEKYLLTYFLDEPSVATVEKIRSISEAAGLKIVNLPYIFENARLGETAVAGPREFVEFIKNASFVCTDSFHGTVFSMNFNVPFYTFERNYGNAGKQSARIESILKLMGMTERYEPECVEDCMDISFEGVNEALANERKRSRDYLSLAIKETV